MRKHSKVGRPQNANLILSNLSVRSESGPLLGYPGSTLPQPIPWESNNRIDRTFCLSVCSHITLRPKVELSRKRISLLLEQEIIRVSSEGFTLLDYFAFEWMFNYLVGNHSHLELKEKKLKVVVYLSKLILLSFRENWNLLYKAAKIHPDVKEFIEQNLGTPNSQKYKGREPVYSKEKFLEVFVEDVQQLTDRSSSSIRYSSYCKGYGESGQSVRRQKTRYSYELDRDDSVILESEVLSSETSLHYLENLFYLEEQIKQEKKKA